MYDPDSEIYEYSRPPKYYKPHPVRHGKRKELIKLSDNQMEQQRALFNETMRRLREEHGS